MICPRCKQDTYRTYSEMCGNCQYGAGCTFGDFLVMLALVGGVFLLMALPALIYYPFS